MHNWPARLFAACAALLLTGCLWGPGKFTSDLTLRKDGSFILDYRGEIVLVSPPDESAGEPWNDKLARCYEDGRTELLTSFGTSGAQVIEEPPPDAADGARPCTAAEIAALRKQYEQQAAETAAKKRQENENIAKLFGLPGFDDESSRAFAAKLVKYAGWRSATYRGKGVYDVDYHFEGRATQDFLFPALPDNDMIVPFVAIRRRADGAVLVTAPAMTGGSGPLASRAGPSASSGLGGPPPSRAEGRFSVITDGEILTNNSEDGASPHPLGRQVRWEVGPASKKIPETLIRL